MMTFVYILLVCVGVFAACYLIDKLFARMFRNKAQHRSGLAVRVNRTYGVMGIGLIVIGIMAMIVDLGSVFLIVCGLMILVSGVAMVAYYLTRGIFYDGSSFLISGLGSKERTYRYQDITGQRLYRVQGGNIIVELYMTDKDTVSVTSNMDGIYPFLDTAFAGWCKQTGRDPEECEFHDPSKHWWFPQQES